MDISASVDKTRKYEIDSIYMYHVSYHIYIMDFYDPDMMPDSFRVLNCFLVSLGSCGFMVVYVRRVWIIKAKICSFQRDKHLACISSIVCELLECKEFLSHLLTLSVWWWSQIKLCSSWKWKWGGQCWCFNTYTARPGCWSEWISWQLL